MRIPRIPCEREGLLDAVDLAQLTGRRDEEADTRPADLRNGR